jgi:hypothetical protein
MELALAANVDQASGFKFLDVVREGSGGDGKGCASLGAAQRTARFGDLLEKFEAARIGKGFKDRGAASAR